MDYLTVVPVLYKALDHAATHAPYRFLRGLAMVGRALLKLPNFLLGIANLAVAAVVTAVLTPIVALVHFSQWCKNKWDARKVTQGEYLDDSRPSNDNDAEESKSCCHSKMRRINATAGQHRHRVDIHTSRNEEHFVDSMDRRLQAQYGQPVVGQPVDGSVEGYNAEVARSMSAAM